VTDQRHNLAFGDHLSGSLISGVDFYLTTLSFPFFSLNFWSGAAWAMTTNHFTFWNGETAVYYDDLLFFSLMLHSMAPLIRNDSYGIY